MNLAQAIPSTVNDDKTSNERVVDIVLHQDELNWRDMLFDLVRQEGMNPWDIDVSLLAERFIALLNQLKELDFRVSGKMVLASSLLLKVKSDRLLLNDLQDFEALLAEPVPEEDFLDEEGSFEYEQYDLNQFLNDQKKIVPRTPQPRERKVSVFDLVDALESALETDAHRQRVLSSVPTTPEVKAPTHVFDLSETMAKLQTKLKGMFVKEKTKVFFHNLVPGDRKEDYIYTFLPLLHLENQQKVDLFQENHFGDIEVVVHNRKFLE